MNPATETRTASKPRRIDQIARAIVRDLRKQDEGNDEVRSAVDQIQGWHVSAGRAGDLPVVCAIEYLGDSAAAATYEHGRGSSKVSDAECDRLVAAVQRRRAR